MVNQENAMDHATNGDFLPLSFQQERIWLMIQRYPEAATMWNMIFQINVEEDLDLFTASQAFDALIERHYSLQTRFILRDFVPVQVKGPYQKNSLREIDLRGKEEEVQEQEIASLISKERAQRFDMEVAPLCRMIIFRTGDHEAALLCVIHHIITDAYSNRLLDSQFRQIYNALKNNQPFPFLPLSRQYTDYVVWQHDYWSNAITTEQRYWVNNFSMDIVAIDLPFKRNREKRRTLSGSGKYLRLNKDVTNRIRVFCKEYNILPFSFFMTAYAILLHKYSRQSDFVISSPFRGRNESEDLNDIIGLFVNIVPFRINTERAQSIEQLLKNNQRQLLLSYKYQSYPLQFLIKKIHAVTDAWKNPLFDVSINFLVDAEREYDDLGITDVQDKRGRFSQHDLDFTIYSLRNEMSLQFAYKEQLFTGDTIEKMLRHLRRIIDIVLEFPDLLIKDVDYLSTNEKHQLLQEFNYTSQVCVQEKSLLDLFDQQVSKDRNAIALHYFDETITYGLLDQKAAQVAMALQQQGFRPGMVAGIWVDRSIEMIGGILGIMKAGGICLPMDVIQPADRVLHMLVQSGAKFILTVPPQERGLFGEITCLNIRKDAPVWEGNPACEKVNSPELAYIIYTSGSTGVPNGVKVSHRSILNYLGGQLATYGITSTDRILQFSSIGFDPSIEQIWLALTSGAGLVIIDKEILVDNEKLNKYLTLTQVTHLHATPSYLNSIELPAINTIKRIVSGGELCSPELAKRLYRRYDFFNKYGPTETTISSTICKVTDKSIQSDIVPIGKPLLNTKCYVLGKELELMPVGVTGELYIGGAGVSAGYINNRELTEKKFVAIPYYAEGPCYRTGDLVKWLPDGQLEFVGRADSQVKIRGFRIELEEIETRIGELEWVTQVAVIVKGEHADKFMVVWYESDGEISTDVFKKYLSNWFPGYMIPGEYRRVVPMPMTASGKVDRKALAAKNIGERITYEAPADDWEGRLVKIWAEVLQISVEKVSVSVSFFEIGGHSLSATKLAFRIFDEFGTEVPLAELLNAPTIREMSGLIRNWSGQQKTSQQVVLLKEGKKDDRQLFMVHDVSGGIEAYVAFSGLLQGYRCRGINNNRQARVWPENLKMEEVAAGYLEQLLLIQPQGPYLVGGWSLGGVIAYEMAHQLDARGEKMEVLLMLDAYLRASNFSDTLMFTLQEEKEFIEANFGAFITIPSAATIEELWEEVVQSLERLEQSNVPVKEQIPLPLQRVIPHLNAIGIRDAITSMNTIRSFQYMSSNYQPQGDPLNAHAVYFRAKGSRSDIPFINSCIAGEVVWRNINGDHHSMLRPPLVGDLVKELTTLI